MTRSNFSVGKFLFVICVASLLAPLAAAAQSATELGAPPKLIVGGGFVDDKLPAMEQEQASRVEALSQERTRYKSGKDMAPAAEPAAKGPTKMEQVEMSLEEVPVTEGVDLTTEALDNKFFRDISRQENLTFQEVFETAGSLQTDVQSIGEIIDGEPSNQVTFSMKDVVYINRGTANGITSGMKFAVLKKGRNSVYHPVSGSYLGNMVTFEGLLEVLESNVKVSKAKVIRSYNVLERGDLITPYEKPLLPSFDPDTPVLDKDINGYIIQARDPKAGMSKGDVVYIDVGSEEGVEVSDIFNVIDNRSVVRNDGKTVEGIPKIIGKVKVISIGENTSTAIIIASKSAMYSGDKIEFSPN
ncbi:MAG: hypothetical protein OEY50_04225 [Nitrospinota bacterium]|nr:hypothetical protein [Nitrospinota bacterium]MDH5677555.1 hypothetical protein [Nitrospinota bacterium]MDH5757051.1 hypothetical protein [Nitrospinota bacterium]